MEGTRLDADKVLFEREGVYIHNTDRLGEFRGRILLIENVRGKFIEWFPVYGGGVSSNFGTDNANSVQQLSPQEDSNHESYHNDSWTVIPPGGMVSFTKNEQISPGANNESLRLHTAANKSKKRSKGQQLLYTKPMRFSLGDILSVRVSERSLTYTHLKFSVRRDVQIPHFHFHEGGCMELVRNIEKMIPLVKCPADKRLYLAKTSEVSALTKSISELKIFEGNARDIASFNVGKFFDPYTATMGSLSKVKNYLLENVLAVNAQPQCRPMSEMADILNEEINQMEINQNLEPGYEIISCGHPLGSRPDIIRESQLTTEEWMTYRSESGQIERMPEIKRRIFKGGATHSLRRDLWKYLLGYYPTDITNQQRIEHRNNKEDDYFRMKHQWKSISQDQEKRFTLLRDMKSLVDKDVHRTDRTHKYYMGCTNTGILYDILMTYCMYNFDLGYVQGMSDLLSPILVVMENEVDGFWCFAGFMEKVKDNFELDQQGMKTQLAQLRTLLKFTDNKFFKYLEEKESGNLYFCFRWLLILYKRDFSFLDIMTLWEVLWSGLPGPNFHLFIALAILDTEKANMMDQDLAFSDILKHINELVLRIDLQDTLMKAEAIYTQLTECPSLPEQIREILYLPAEEPAGSQGSRAGTANKTDSSSETESEPQKASSTGQEHGEDSSIEVLTDTESESVL